MTQTPEELYKEGLEKYNAGEAPSALIPLFKEITTRSPKSSSTWISLSWLYLLEKKPKSAYKAAKTGVKLNPDDPQGRINLALAMLEIGEKGVRTHIDRAQQMIMADSDWLKEIKNNIQDGSEKRSDWSELNRIKSWLFDL
ncbi:MAG: tetratricopeptide repeat protein [Trichodesmium sp.]